MPRPGPKPDDLEFDIHVDPSCLSEPDPEPELMDDDVPPKVAEVEVEDTKDGAKGTAEAVKEEDVIQTETGEKKDEEDTTTPEPVPEASQDVAPEDQPETKLDEAEPASGDSHTAAEVKTEEAAATQDEPDSQPADTPGANDDDDNDNDKTTAEAVEGGPEQTDDAKSEQGLSEEAPALAAEEEAKPEEPEPEPQSEPEQEAQQQEEEEAPQAEPETQPEPQPQEEVDDEPSQQEPEPQPQEVEEEMPQEELEPQEEVEEDIPQEEPKPQPEEEVEEEEAHAPEADITTSDLAKQVEEALAMAHAESEETPAPAPVVDAAQEDLHEDADVRGASRSSSSLRRASGRTEALIQAAAKEVLERLEAQTMETIRNRSHSRQDSTGSTRDGTELHYGNRSDYGTRSGSTRRESYATRSRASRRESDVLPTPMHTEDGGDSSSQHGADSDVFSDRSPRSSLGSFDGHVDHHHHHDASNRSSKRSSRMSDISMSDMSHYDKEDFVPTIRGTNRMPFRTPSDVRAMQYSSPAPSVIGSHSPRSNKRAQMPTISRLGSPTVSTQYSPKGRTTPTRFKAKKEPPPLVLLHVTLLPLRWQWAETLEAASFDILSPEAKTLREAWHHLHDRVAETVCERGILLSHPQEDYEILEERLLEALDLPLRRRARVLECGHYIGPSNEMNLGEDSDSDEDEYDEDPRRRSALVKTHWCQTCRHDIRYESLGPGKIFRIKVYASNGLMRTGAWAACWKEMERVDVEIEPIVGSNVLDELEHLAIAQSQQLELVKHDPAILESTEGRDLPEDLHRGRSGFDRDMPSSMDRGIPALVEPPQEEEDISHLEETNFLEPKYIEHEAHAPLSSPPPAAEEIRSPSPEPMPRYDQSEERRLRDEARMREIYGLEPEPEQHEPVPEPQPEPRHESYSAQSPPPPQQHSEPPPQPQQQQQQQQQQHYHQDQQQQHHAPPPARQQAFQNAGLGELLLEAARVFMQDKKNLAIVVMSLLVLFMAVKPAPRAVREWDGKFVEHVVPDVHEAPASSPPLMETVQSVVESVTASEVALSEAAPSEVAPSEATVQIVVQPTPEVEVEAEAEVPEPSQEIPVSQPTAEPVQSSSSEALEPSSSSSSVEEQPSPSSSPSPSASSSASSQEVEAAAPTAVHQTITTREVVRIIETVTETVKAIVTETEVVKIQATPSVAPEVLVEDQDVVVDDAVVEDEAVVEDAAQVEEEVSETEDAPTLETTLPGAEAVEEDDEAIEEAEAAVETALPTEPDAEYAVLEKPPAVSTAAPVEDELAEDEDVDEEQAEPETDDHDEL
ncbi:hypothetical protein EsH8_II_000607 [Colletotrichum jinshuiense]